jgi:hypothetical protein
LPSKVIAARNANRAGCQACQDISPGFKFVAIVEEDTDPLASIFVGLSAIRTTPLVVIQDSPRLRGVLKAQTVYLAMDRIQAAISEENARVGSEIVQLTPDAPVPYVGRIARQRMIHFVLRVLPKSSINEQ